MFWLCLDSQNILNKVHFPLHVLSLFDCDFLQEIVVIIE